MTKNRIKDFLDVLLKGKTWEEARGRLAFEHGDLVGSIDWIV